LPNDIVHLDVRQQHMDQQPAQMAEPVAEDLARKLNAIRSLADKQLSSLYQSIKPLKDVGYHRFTKQLKRQALAYGWPPHIMTDTDDLSDEDRGDLNANTVEGLSTLLHIRNAYVIITAMCDGHQVEHLLEGCEESRARAALDIIKQYFYPSTTAGKRIAYKTFNNATMANTHTNIVEWVAVVRQNAQYLRQVGGQADDDAELAVLLSGLLPDFEKLKLILDEDDQLTLTSAIKRLTNHARSHGLLEVAKGKGTAPSGAKVFVAKAPVQPCYQWSKNSCRYGKFCKFSHEAPGGGLAAITDQPGPGPRRPRRPPGATNVPPGSRVQQPLSEAAAPAAAATYTAHEAPAAASFMATATNRPYCYICCSAEHETSECTSGGPAPAAMLAASHDQLSSVTPSVSWLSWVLLLLVACVSGAWMALSKLTRALTMPALRSVLIIVFIALLVSMTRVQASSTPARVSAKCFLHAPVNNEELEQNYEWVTDTGSNRFITNDTNDFVPKSVRLVNTRVLVGNGVVISPCEGTVMVRCHASGRLIACTHTLLLRECGKKLMPAHPFLEKECTLSMSGKRVLLLDANKDVILDGKEIDGLYYYNASTAHITGEAPIPLESHGNQSEGCASFFGLPLSGKISAAGDQFARKLTEAHHALGHMHFDKVRKLFGLKRGENPDCATCAIANQKKAQLKVHEYTRATRPNYRIHIDIAYTEGSENPWQLYVDDFSRMSHLDLLESKGDTLPRWEELKTMLENRHYPNKIAFIKTDNEFVYTSTAWIDHCRAEGVVHEFSARYRHDQNGVVERAIGVVGTTFRCLMIQGGAPNADIPNALVHANVIRNNTPTAANNGQTPKEKEAGMKLGINARLLKGPLFCLCYAHIYEEERVKHGPRGVACVYLGYDDRNDQFKVKEWLSGRIYYSGDAVFHPNVFPYRASPATSAQWIREMDLLSPRVPVSKNNPAPHAMPTGPRRSDRQHGYIYSGGKDLRLLPDVDHAPVDCSRVLFVHSFGANPDNWSEALASRFAQEWILASLKEKASFRQHNVYGLVPRAEAEATNKKIYTSRPVFVIKIDPPTSTNPDATINKFKFRQTIAAYSKSMKLGVDFAEKRASTVRWESTLVQIAIAVMFDLEIVLLDICTFFLYGVLDDLVYMEQPPEWVDARYPASEYVCRLNRSMYGLPQAPHCAQTKLKANLTKTKVFTQTAADDCVFVSGKPGDVDYAATGTHVDDLLAIGTVTGISKLTSTLKTEFEITEKRDPTLVTGVQIERNRPAKWLKLHQAAYVDAILAEFGQSDCNPADTPMDAATTAKLMQLPVATAADADPVVQSAYRTLVGMLIWLYKTRPDMLFTINLLARYLSSSTKAHLNLARGRPLRYLKGTKFHGLVFSPGESSEWQLSGSSDADLAGDRASSRSTVGFFNKFGQYGAVAYNCSLERKIASSTQQAETYAMASMVKSTIWLRQLTHELGMTPKGPTSQLTDNRGVYLQSSKQVNHATAKHFRIAQALIRNLQDDGIIKTGTVATQDNPADFFTKGSIPKVLFLKHRLAVMDPHESPP
jgi:hypothetical protein